VHGERVVLRGRRAARRERIAFKAGGGGIGIGRIEMNPDEDSRVVLAIRARTSSGTKTSLSRVITTRRPLGFEQRFELPCEVER